MNSFWKSVFVIGVSLSTSLPARSLPAQDLRCDPGDVEVRGLSFDGNRAFSDAELASAIVTTPSGWARRFLRLPTSVKYCLDRAELPNDRLRLIVFYRRRGFPDVAVDTVVTSLGKSAVEIRFRIREGRPVTIAELAIKGLEGVAGSQAIVRGLPVRAGGRFDRAGVEAARDSIVRRLRNTGYPQAQVEHKSAVDAARYLAWDTLDVRPGPLTRLGGLEIAVTPFETHERQISDRTVRKILGLERGDLYREQDLLNAQRRLYQTEAYQHVTLFPDSVSPTDSIIRLHAVLIENAMNAARLGAGYGTLDCFRVTGELSNYNFLKRARRLDLTTRVSKIGIGEPLSGAKALCGEAKGDPYSNKLNYYAGATLRQPLYAGLRAIPAVTVYTERVSEYKAYLRTTAVGGIASVIWRQWESTPVSVAYAVDYGRTEAQPALFCAVFNVCDIETRQRFQETQRLAVLSATVTRDNTNNLISPSRGGVVRLEGRHASPAILSDPTLRFNKLQGEAARYWGIGGGNVLALRVRAGSVFGKTFGAANGFVPPQERLYAGGPTTVRGFNQNELGSAIYIANRFDTVVALPDTFFRADTTRSYRRTVPLGGNSLFVANAEIRLRSPILPDVLQWTLFTDAGDVWNRGLDVFDNFQIKVTPGFQLGAFTPVGPVRIVVGYNPYRRPAGPLYFEANRQEGGGLPCVSPGNRLKVHATTEAGQTVLVQEEGGCPSTFRPPADASFRSRLTLSLAIGQAF
jgi:outer membrane protein insertion porin family